VVTSKLVRFTRQVSSVSKPSSAIQTGIQNGLNGYAEWVIGSIHILNTYLDVPSGGLLGALLEMTRSTRFFGLEVTQPSDLGQYVLAYIGVKCRVGSAFSGYR
jgi:hypothetical protein